MDDKLIVDRVNELIDRYLDIETEVRNLKEAYALGYRYLDENGKVIKDNGNVIHFPSTNGGTVH